MAEVQALNRIIEGDNQLGLASLPDGFARLIYIDPPFNTGEVQHRRRMKVRSGEDQGRSGFHGRKYSVESLASPSYTDEFDDYLGFLMPRIEASLRCLTPDGSLMVHLDDREVHYVKVALDRLLGRRCFMNEIIWSYDYGARSQTRWPRKHDTILWYALQPTSYIFNYDQMDRIPYMAPKLVPPEKAALGKTPTDVWWHTIVPTTGKEKTGYPTQKPLGILSRIVRVHTNHGDCILDYFAGSGTTGEAAGMLDRRFVLIDDHPEAIEIMTKRLAKFEPLIERIPLAEEHPLTASDGVK